jgi:hypothetical protein
MYSTNSFWLVSGQLYTISWLQQGRPSNQNNSPNDINFSYGVVEIVNTDWESENAEFTATGEKTILKICSTNPNGGDKTTFIDNIVLTKNYEEIVVE